MKWLQKLRGGDSASYTPPPGVAAPSPPQRLVLYKTDWCPFCVRVMKHVDALGLNAEVERADIASDSKAREQLIDATGRQTVPCLFIDGSPFFESRDINDWLSAYAERLAAASDG